MNKYRENLFINDNTNKTLSVREFGETYNIGINKAYQIVNMPNFPMIKLGKKILIIREKVDKWFEENIGKTL